MSFEGFFALLVLLLATGTSLAMSCRPEYRRVFHYPKGSLYVRYHTAGWSSLLLAAGLCWWLLSYSAEPEVAGVLRLGPQPFSSEYLLPLVFLFLGSAIAFLLALMLLLCGGIVMPRRGHRLTAQPADDGTQPDSPWIGVVVGVVVWLPSLLGYELMRDTSLQIDDHELRFDSMFSASADVRTWQEVARLEYRPWYGHSKGTKLHHAMALVMHDGTEWNMSDDGFWGLDDLPTRDRLRAMASGHGVEYRHLKAD